MSATQFKRQLLVPDRSTINPEQYTQFAVQSYELMAALPQYFSPDEDINSLELHQTRRPRPRHDARTSHCPTLAGPIQPLRKRLNSVNTKTQLMVQNERIHNRLENEK